jgi:hypothetical protein
LHLISVHNLYYGQFPLVCLDPLLETLLRIVAITP